MTNKLVLQGLYANYYTITNEDVEKIYIKDSVVKNLTVNAPNLKIFNAEQCGIETINLVTPVVTDINLMLNKLTTFSGEFPSLEKLNLEYNNLTKFEVTSYQLTGLNISRNYNLDIVNLKYNSNICPIIADTDKFIYYVKNSTLIINPNSKTSDYDLDRIDNLKKVKINYFKTPISIKNDNNVPIYFTKFAIELISKGMLRGNVSEEINSFMTTNSSDIYYDTKLLTEYKNKLLGTYEIGVKTRKCRCHCFQEAKKYELYYNIEDRKLSFTSKYVSTRMLYDDNLTIDVSDKTTETEPEEIDIVESEEEETAEALSQCIIS